MSSARGHQTRLHIASVALSLLGREGAAGLTMRQLAAECDRSLSNVQYHFGSRSELLEGITEVHLQACHDAMAGALGEQPDWRRAVRVSLCHPEVQQTAPPFRALFALAVHYEAVEQRLHAHFRGLHDALVGLLLAESPEADPAVVHEAATLLSTSIEGMYLLAAATPVSPERLADRLIEAVEALLARR
jgi:AcrR family transcriptional regulator